MHRWLAIAIHFGPHPVDLAHIICFTWQYLPRGTILPNSTFLCAQAMRHARGLYKPQATSEHDLHTKRFVSACSVHWYLLVPSTMKIATSRGLLRWLAGWPPFRAALRPRSKRAQRACVSVACALHCGYIIGTKFQRAACLSAREHTSS